MLIGIFADIHANRQAFSACLAQARASSAERIVLLGDYVGYGANPEWTVTTVMDLVEQGAIAVQGNHDSAVGNPREDLNVEARVVIEWTRGELGQSQRQFLANLPLTRKEEDRLFVHAEASRPEKWNYVKDVADARRSIMATSAHVTFLRPLNSTDGPSPFSSPTSATKSANTVYGTRAKFSTLYGMKVPEATASLPPR